MGSTGGEKVFSVSLLVQTMLRVSLFLTNEEENKQASGTPEPNPAIPTNTSILIFSVDFRKFSIQKTGESLTNKTRKQVVGICSFISIIRCGLHAFDWNSLVFFLFAGVLQKLCRVWAVLDGDLYRRNEVSCLIRRVTLSYESQTNDNSPALSCTEVTQANGFGLCLLTHTRIY